MNFLFHDYETLSQDQDTAPVVCLALCLVDTDVMQSDEPYTLSKIREISKFYKFNIDQQVKEYDRIIETECLDWWKEKVDVKVRIKLLSPSENDLDIKEIPRCFLDCLGDNSLDYIFSRGNFDPEITRILCRYFGVDEPYAWWCIRDTRSFLDGILWGTGIDQNFTPKADVEFSLHDPIDDIALDILRFQTAIRAVSNG